MTDPTKDPSLISEMVERGRLISDQMPEQIGALILPGYTSTPCLPRLHRVPQN